VHCSLEGDYSCERPRVRFADGGRLLQLSFARSPAAEWNAEQFGARGGVRGKCKGFSFGCRRRLLNRLNSVSVAARLPYFVTCTLPDDVFDDNVSSFAATAKVWLDNFTKRLQRVCPDACGFWRIEWQARKSGEYEGKLVPHFHLLVWGLPDRRVSEDVIEAYVDVRDNQLQLELVRTLGAGGQRAEADVVVTTTHGGETFEFAGTSQMVRHCQRLLDKVRADDDRPERAEGKMAFADWASLAWYHVVESHNVKHLAAGVRVERSRSWGGVLSYCAKYLAKADCEFLYDRPLGRAWGIFNRKAVPWAKMIELPLDVDVGVRLRRVARRYLEHRFGRRVRVPYGVTVYCDVEKFRRLWRPSPDPDPF